MTMTQTKTPEGNNLLTAFPAHVHDDAQVLVLGSMPGVASLERQQYYAHPRNSFWPIMFEVFGDGKPSKSYTYKESLALLADNQIALWDVLKHCQRQGSLDANIRLDSAICNDFLPFLDHYRSIRKILFNGKTAERLFMRHIKPKLDDRDIDTVGLPSTSPAMAAMTFAEKKAHWLEALID